MNPLCFLQKIAAAARTWLLQRSPFPRYVCQMSVCRPFSTAFFSISLAVAFYSVSAVAEPSQLSKDDLSKVVKTDAITVPTPGEIFAALGKEVKPNWQSAYRPPIPTTFTSRPQLALNLGGLIADGYIAVEAEDSQQVKNIGKDIINLAKALGVSKSILARGSSITDFADKSEWNTLKEELEETQNEVKQAMSDEHDQELITLVTLGGWIRGTGVVSSLIVDNYTPGSAKLIRQPALVSFMRNKLKELPEKTRTGDPLVKSLDEQLGGIEKLVTFPKDTVPTLDDVKKLRDTANGIENQISNK